MDESTPSQNKNKGDDDKIAVDDYLYQQKPAAVILNELAPHKLHSCTVANKNDEKRLFHNAQSDCHLSEHARTGASR